MSIGAALLKARHRLEDAGIPDAAFEAELLLRHALWLASSDPPAVGPQHAGVLRLEAPLASRAYVFTHSDEALPPGTASLYESLLLRRLTREPAAYILGYREFYGLDLVVTPATLIPRPETELLVEAAIELSRRHSEAIIADLGTGSGAIAIALAKSLPRAVVYAVDVSSEALGIARLNAERHDVSSRIAFRRGDLLEPVDVRLDLIVANLPYVSAGELRGLEPEVRDHEPALALAAGIDGLDLIRRLLQQASRYLRPDGAICLEFGYGQTKALSSLAHSSFPEAAIVVAKDLAGIDRVMTIRP